MREYLNEHHYANLVRQLRESPRYQQAAAVLVEGDTDRRLFTPLLVAGSIIQDTNGRPRALAALAILERDNFPGVVAIVDADFDRLEGRVPPSANVLWTDTHDAETMLLHSRLEKLLHEHGGKKKLESLGAAPSAVIRDALLRAGLALGYLRWLSDRDQLALKFSTLSFAGFVDKKTVELDVLALAREIRNKSQRFDIDEQDLRGRAAALADPAHDPWQVCCGHDLCELLALGLCGPWGNFKQQEMTAERIEADLRLAFSSEHFAGTALRGALREWEMRNPLYPVLAT